MREYLDRNDLFYPFIDGKVLSHGDIIKSLGRILECIDGKKLLKDVNPKLLEWHEIQTGSKEMGFNSMNLAEICVLHDVIDFSEGDEPLNIVGYMNKKIARLQEALNSTRTRQNIEELRVKARKDITHVAEFITASFASNDASNEAPSDTGGIENKAR